MSEVDLGGTACAWLLAIGALSGAASVWAFLRWSDQAKLRVAANGIFAHLMEFRLFANEPALILRAQWNLLKANATLLSVLLRPSLFLLVPFALMLAALDGFFARGALHTGEPAVITMQESGNFRDATLQAPEGISIETPAVRVADGKQLSWRIRPLRAVSGLLTVKWERQTVQKSVRAGEGWHWIAPQRSRSWLGFALHPHEWPVATKDVDWVRMEYPDAAIFGFHWWIWYSAGACIGTLFALRRGL